MSTRSPDEIRPLYRAILLLGLGAIVILVAGGLEFLAFEPPGQASGLRVRIEGVIPYNPSSHAQFQAGKPQSSFKPDQPFAAVVDWASLPPETVVAGRWYDSLGEEVGDAGPAAAGQMDGQLVPVQLPPGLKRNIPGTYYFVVERFSRAQPVEVLGRVFVEVERT